MDTLASSQNSREETHLDPTLQRYVECPDIAYDYDACFANNLLFKLDENFVLSHVNPKDRVLDLGCGTGRHLKLLAYQGCRAVGVDMSSHMLEVCYRKGLCRSGHIQLVRADLASLPFVDESFDVALLMFSVLGMISGRDNRKKVIEGVRRILRPGGKVIIHTHNRNYRYSPNRRFASQLASKVGMLKGRLEDGDIMIKGYRAGIDLRLHLFTLDELSGLVTENGFELSALHGINDRRNGLCDSVDLDQMANGFFAVGEKRVS